LPGPLSDALPCAYDDGNEAVFGGNGMSKKIGRRNFLSSGVRVLPALAAMGLVLGATGPARADCSDNCSGSCYQGCTGSCMDGCTGSCKEGCTGSCMDGCTGGSK